MSAQLTNIVLDTCSLLNMVSGNVLAKICCLPYQFSIGPIVYDECTKQPCMELEDEINKGRIAVLDGSGFSVGLFSQLLAKYGLGDGETECISYGSALGYAICTDDRLARESALKELGPQRVIGTIGLLKLTTTHHLTSCQESFKAYQLMVKYGGFLPKLKDDYFC